MPKYKAHLFGGFIIFIIIVAIITKISQIKLTIPLSFIFLASCLVGSLFPDIDTKSRIQKWIYLPTFLVIIATIITKNWFLLSLLAVIAFIPILANHRHLTHKLWFVTLVPLTIPLLTLNYNKSLFGTVLTCYLFFVAGALSHIFLDFGPKRFFRR
jgi:hypothetical protein